MRTWIRRYNDSEKISKTGWFKEESRAPKNVHRKTDSEIEQLVVNVRKSLLEEATEDTKYRCIGAVEIQFRMHELGYLEDETPSLSTIKRIIKRNGLIVQKRKRYIRCKSKKRYTLLNPTKANDVHQMDFVGPRHIMGYGRISSLNLIDVVGGKAHIQQYAGQTMDNVIEFLLDCWIKNAIPNYLQMDNGASFIGDLIHSRHFSRVVRLCLHFGVEAVFIAPSKPWMNGSIENFNNWFGSKFWDKETFEDMEDIRTRSPYFVDHHNDLDAWKKRNDELRQIEPVRMLKDAVEINLNKIPLMDGKIHFIRQVGDGGRINVLNEAFKVGEEFISEYVWATICMGRRKMEVYYRAKDQDAAVLIKEFNYELNEEVEPLREDI